MVARKCARFIEAMGIDTCMLADELIDLHRSPLFILRLSIWCQCVVVSDPVFFFRKLQTGLVITYIPDSIAQQRHLGKQAGSLATQRLLRLPGLLAVGSQELQVLLSSGCLQLLRIQSLPRPLQILTEMMMMMMMEFLYA